MQVESLEKMRGCAASSCCERALLAHGCGEGFVGATAAANINSKAFDLLVQRRKGNHKSLGSFGLIPAGAFEHVHDDTALDLVHDLEERRLRVIGGGTGARFSRQRR